MANVDAAEEDRIVRTIDVHICSPKTVSSHAQVQLLQYPLRPPWRPYDVGQCTGVRVKTGMRRLEMDLPVDRQSRNYDPEAKEDVRHLQKLTLQSTTVDQHAQFAVGRFTSDGKLLLLPVAESVLMRPKTSHFDAALKAHAASTARSLEGEAADTKEPPTQQLHRLEVQVRKRETERQAEQRMRSYQWLSEQDAKEPWMDLQVITNASSFASVTWDQVAQDAGLGTDPAIMDRRDYFELAFPPTESTNSSAAAPSSGSPDGAGSGGSGDGIAASGGYGAAGAGTLRSGGLSPASASAGVRLDLGLQRELTQAVTTLLKQHSVGNMADIRGWLLTSPERLRELGQSKDDVLHEALMATGVVDRIRTTYVLRSTGDPALDEVRSIILELLAHKETVKKSDVMEAAARRGLNVTGGQYQRCIKDLCSSRGNSWFIKPGKES